MLYPSINKIRKKADSRYTLVIRAAKRARDIIDGKPALTEDSVNRPVSIAAHEIAEDLITYVRDGADSIVEEEPEGMEVIEMEPEAGETVEGLEPDEEAVTEGPEGDEETPEVVEVEE